MQKIRKAYKFRLKTTSEIESKLLRYCGSSLLVWNKCLSMNLELLEKKQSILDQGWHGFHRMLEYKLDWQGGSLVEVDSRHTSQRCSCCGYTSKANRISQAVFRC